MKIAMGLAAVLLVTACGSNASDDSAPTESEPVVTAPAGDPDTTVVAEPSNIVNHYDTATCGDWRVTDKMNRKIVSTYFLVRANDRTLDGFEVTLRTSITVACRLLPADVTVKRVAERSIKNLQGD